MLGLTRRIRLIFIPLLFLLTSSQSFAHNMSQCPNVNLSSHFGPDRDQDGHGYCWAFAGAALLEEDLCLRDKALCGKSVSPLDISHCSFGLQNSLSSVKHIFDGWETSEALKCARTDGVCLEQFAPYTRSVKSLRCHIEDFFSYGENCVNEQLVDLFRQFKKDLKDCLKCREKNPPLEIREKLNSTVEAIQRLVPENTRNGVDVKSVLFSAENERDYLMKISITPQCIGNRFSFRNFEVRDKSFSVDRQIKGESADDKILLIGEVLKSGRSVSLSICTGKMKDARRECGATHALIANGMRWNVGKCEINLKNSWGRGAQFHGWHDAQAIMNAATEIIYLKGAQ